MLSIENFKNTYAPDTIEVVIADKPYKLFVPANLDRFIDPDDPLRNFPLWAKVWEASGILATELAQRPVQPRESYLEIGGGLGLVSIVAADYGHNVTLSEYQDDALAFARANAALNECPDLDIVKLDWHQPQALGTFDYLIGTDVIYRKESFTALTTIFDLYLKPGGEIILAEGVRPSVIAFFKSLQSRYDIKAAQKVLRSQDEEIRILLAHIKTRSPS